MGERMMRRIPTATSDDELADMAERGELAPIGEPSGPVRFESAEELAQFIVNAHPVGRPNLGEDRAAGRGRSPRRQVRLPQDLNTRLDAYARAQETTVSDIIRDALTDYLDAHALHS